MTQLSPPAIRTGESPAVPVPEAAPEVGPIPAAGPRVVVLLATWNGAANLAEQLESLRRQLRLPARLIVSDDGSTDTTPEILRAFAASDPGFAVELRSGPRRGGAQNFMSLLRAVPEDADLVALCDQDDVWLPDKISRGIRLLRALPPGQPALLGGRTFVCDERLGNRQPSPLMRRGPGFRNALVQNFAGGNTMMLNRAAIALAREAAAEAGRVVLHDWWLYQLISGAGGQVIYDEVPLLLYRQHETNQVGANTGSAAKLRRMRWMLRGRFRRWNAINLAALAASAHRLTPENRAILEGFARMQRAGLIERLRILRQLKLYRQGLSGTLSLWLAALLGRV